jgi:hypothetical protein
MYEIMIFFKIISFSKKCRVKWEKNTYFGHILISLNNSLTKLVPLFPLFLDTSKPPTEITDLINS